MLKKAGTRRSVFDSTVAAQANPLTPMQVADSYNFPNGHSIDTQRVAIVELGGGVLGANINWYCDQMNVARPNLGFYGVDGNGNSYFPSDADGEVDLDIDVIAAVCNRGLAKGAAGGINIDTVFAPNTTAGFVDAILYAADKLPSTPAAISISWGGPESGWSDTDRAAMDAAFQHCLAKGIGVYCAAGDNGSSDGTDGNMADYPASSPYVVACGGTRLILNSDGTRASETVWDINNGNGATGGGFSAAYPIPSEQGGLGTGSKFRAVPDVSGNADPVTGYQVKVDFQDQVVGGTSAVAPLYAALHAIIQSYFPEPLGDLKPVFYALAANGGFFDVISGSNGAYSAGPGFDECTGLGVVDGTKLLTAVTQAGQAHKTSIHTMNKMSATAPAKRFQDLPISVRTKKTLLKQVGGNPRIDDTGSSIEDDPICESDDADSCSHE